MSADNLGNCPCGSTRRFSVVHVQKRDPMLRREILDFVQDADVRTLAQEVQAKNRARESGDPRLQVDATDSESARGGPAWVSGRRMLRRPLRDTESSAVGLTHCRNFPDHDLSEPYLSAIIALRARVSLAAWSDHSPSPWVGGYRYGAIE